jgi:hypothetical protein
MSAFDPKRKSGARVWCGAQQLLFLVVGFRRRPGAQCPELLFWRPQMAAVPRRLKRIEVYCPEYETTATIRINDAHSSGTDHLEVDYRSPDHSHFTIAIPDDWTDQDLLELIFFTAPRSGKT